MSALEARQNYIEVEALFTVATEQLLQASIRQAGLEIALKRGILASDALVQEVDKALARASLQLWTCRQSLQAAADALAQAERDAAQQGQPSRFEQQLELARLHDPALFERYQSSLVVEAAADGYDAESRARHIRSSLEREIKAFRVPAEVAG